VEDLDVMSNAARCRSDARSHTLNRRAKVTAAGRVATAALLILFVSVACANDQAGIGTVTTPASAHITTSIAPETTIIPDLAATPTLPQVQANPGWRQLEVAPLAGRTWHSTTWTGGELVIWGGVLPTTGTAYDETRRD
jgi:hypothetical protein